MNLRHFAIIGAILTTPAAARAAEEGEREGAPRSAVRESLSPSITAGIAILALNYGQYGPGFTVRGGADRRLSGSLDQRLGAAVSFTRFTIPGAMLDLATTEATYRLYPFRIPIFVDASAGLLVSREAFDVTLARGRTIDDVQLRIGAPAGLGVGATLFRHVELAATYRQTLFFGGEGPITFGHATLALGGRF